MGFAVARKGADACVRQAVGDRLDPLNPAPVIAEFEAGSDRAAEDQRAHQRGQLAADGPRHPLVHERQPAGQLSLADAHPALERETNGLKIRHAESVPEVMRAAGLVEPTLEIAAADCEQRGGPGQEAVLRALRLVR